VWLQVPPVRTGTSGLRPLIEAALRHRLPVMGLNSMASQAGALASYGPNIAALFERTADYVDMVLRGARPAELPIERPSKFDLIINKQTAAALGLTIPPDVLARATEVIQ
jgi:putative tryptophan/tyrosine transport system substrate-binding protein